MSTKIWDIAEPFVYAAYIREAILSKSNIIKSGIVTQNDRLNHLATVGGRTIKMPIWGRITGDSEILSDEIPLVTNKISAKEDEAVLHMRGKAWGANELASSLAGDSAISAIASMIADYWVAEEQKILVASLCGAFATTSMSKHVFGNGTGIIDAKMTLNAKQLLGDAASSLTAIVMHSATYTDLQKQDLVTFYMPSEGGKPISTYLGLNVIVDDTMPVTAGVYSTFLLADGVIGRGEGTPVDFTPFETQRDGLLGEDIIISRRMFALHPFGVKWYPTDVEKDSPSLAELRNGENWKRVYDDKNIGMVMIKHKLSE